MSEKEHVAPEILVAYDGGRAAYFIGEDSTAIERENGSDAALHYRAMSDSKSLGERGWYDIDGDGDGYYGWNCDRYERIPLTMAPREIRDEYWDRQEINPREARA